MHSSTLSGRLATRASTALALAAVTLLGACQDDPTALRQSPEPRASAERSPINTLAGDTTEPILYSHRSSTAAWQIYRINQDKSGFTQITTGAEHFDPTRTHFLNKANDKLAYVERNSATQSRVIVANVDGSNPVAVTPYLRDIRHPSFRYDGKAITFSAQVPFPGGLTYHAQVFTVNTTNGALARITFDNNDNIYPFWRSTDQIVFIGGAAGQRQLYGIAPAGGTQRQLTAHPPGDMSALGMSRDGVSFLFVLNKGKMLYVTGRTNGIVANAGVLSETFSDPAFSPDDNAVVFIDKDGATSRLVRLNVTGAGGFALLNTDGHNDISAAWAQ